MLLEMCIRTCKDFYESEQTMERENSKCIRPFRGDKECQKAEGQIFEAVEKQQSLNCIGWEI